MAEAENGQMEKVRIILASGSPRRRELLAREGVPFEVRVSNVDEALGHEFDHKHEAAAEQIAQRKAGAVVQELLTEGITGPTAVIGADTVVALNNQRYGKPVNVLAARSMLFQLSGRTHRVITGVSVWMLSLGPDGQLRLGQRTLHETSLVTFKTLTSQQIQQYVATGEPMDKAGAYAIQGGAADFVERYQGDYDNIVGLPVKRLLAEFPEIFAAAGKAGEGEPAQAEEGAPEAGTAGE